MDPSRLLPDGARDVPDTPSSTVSPPERDRTIFSLSADPSFAAYYEALQPLLWILRLLGLWQPPTAGAFSTRVYPVLICLAFLALPWVLFVLNLATNAVSRSGIFSGLYQLPLMMLNLVSLSAFYYARIYFKVCCLLLLLYFRSRSRFQAFTHVCKHRPLSLFIIPSCSLPAGPV